MRIRALACSGVVFSVVVLGQAAAEKPAFDITDVRVSPRATWAKTPPNAMQGGFLIGDRYELRRATMLDLIARAYGVPSDKVYGGPPWLDYDKFDVVAKARPGTKPPALNQMLQTVLEDRFKLVVKHDVQPLPAYVLTLEKDQSKLKSAEAPGSGCQNQPPGIRTGPGGPPDAEIRCTGVTMDQFAVSLRQLASGYFDNLPVVNSTGLEGYWDIDLKYPPRVFRISAQGAEPIDNGGGVFTSVQRELGLKLELGKAPQEVLSVDSVLEQPSPNAPGVEVALPPLPPPQFEVASIRPCEGAVRMAPPRFEAGGRVTAACVPLLLLLRQSLESTGNDQLPGLPKFLQGNSPDTQVSLVAKAPDGIAPNPTDPATRDLMNSMMKALLADRYKLAYHYENRQVDALTLVATKPKLTKADPSERTGCTRASGLGTGTKLTCKNITMQQFAEQILGFYPAARYPVQDGTHLEGAWNFTIEFNPALGLLQDLQSQVRARAGGDAPPALDDSAPSRPANLAEAIEKQTGLKLETHKRNEPVLVIDHMEEKPTDN